MIHAEFEPSYEGWRDCARKFIRADVPPGDIDWDEEARSLPGLFDQAASSVAPKISPAEVTVAPEFLKLAESVAYARDPGRWALLYRLLYRLQHENPELLNMAVDPDVHRANALAKSVRRDIHKMHAFVRFKHTKAGDEDVYVAWHRPEHLIVRPATPFFARRFGDRRWSIFTPEGSAHWDLKTLTFGPGMPQSEFLARDDWDEVWKTYYKSIFNPARMKIKAMKAEMAPKYWGGLPEASLIPELVRAAPMRLQAMAKSRSKAADVDPTLPLAKLRKMAKGCTACPLYKLGTQTVFGLGPEDAEIMIVGEQPGNEEDLQGKPFVGPAGKILMQALEQAGIDPERVYFTNAVKHFKWVPRGKRRLHQKPSGAELHACNPWLQAELAQIKPKLLFALGSTAGTAILGRVPKITKERGQVLRDVPAAPAVVLSWHPSAILRTPAEDRDKRMAELVADLKNGIKKGQI